MLEFAHSHFGETVVEQELVSEFDAYLLRVDDVCLLAAEDLELTLDLVVQFRGESALAGALDLAELEVSLLAGFVLVLDEHQQL